MHICGHCSPQDHPRLPHGSPPSSSGSLVMPTRKFSTSLESLVRRKPGQGGIKLIQGAPSELFLILQSLPYLLQLLALKEQPLVCDNGQSVPGPGRCQDQQGMRSRSHSPEQHPSTQGRSPVSSPLLSKRSHSSSSKLTLGFNLAAKSSLEQPPSPGCFSPCGVVCSVPNLTESLNRPYFFLQMSLGVSPSPKGV